MSEAEMQIEEESLQLTPEDIRLLGEILQEYLT